MWALPCWPVKVRDVFEFLRRQSGKWPLPCFAVLFVVFASPALAARPLTLWTNIAPAALKQLCRSFSAETGIKIRTRSLAGPDYAPALLDRVASDTLPDMALIPADMLALDRELRFSEIPDSLQSPSLVPNAVTAGVQNGRMLGAPISWGNHLMLYYNRDLVPRPAATFDEMARQAPALQARGVKVLGMNFGEMYWFVPFLGA